MRALDHVFFDGSRRLPRNPPAPAVAAVRPGHPRQPEPVIVDEFLVWLFAQAGMCARRYHGRSLTRRLPACLRELRVPCADAARRTLEERPALLPRALDTVLLGVTQFYRDRPVFDCLRDHVLPELIRAGQPIRAWSAACSDGHELYSVGMLLDCAGALGGSDLLGTDCRRTAIERARSGLFPVEALNLLPASDRARFFASATAGTVRIAEHLRSATRWAQQDLFHGAATGPWDLILWRNMAIYLQPDAADSLWLSVWRELRPGGYLIAGKADHPPPHLGWNRIAACVYRKSEAGR